MLIPASWPMFPFECIGKGYIAVTQDPQKQIKTSTAIVHVGFGQWGAGQEMRVREESEVGAFNPRSFTLRPLLLSRTLPSSVLSPHSAEESESQAAAGPEHCTLSGDSLHPACHSSFGK